MTESQAEVIVSSLQSIKNDVGSMLNDYIQYMIPGIIVIMSIQTSLLVVLVVRSMGRRR